MNTRADFATCIAASLFFANALVAHAGEYDPFEDKQLSCEEMAQYPDRVFTGSIDLGSGSGSPIGVDYQCKESLNSLPFLQRLLAMAEEIRSEEWGGYCTGTIVKALHRYYLFSLLKAGFAPQQMLEQHAEAQKRAERYPELTRTNVNDYFERWSYEGLYNFLLHLAFLQEIEVATPLLAEHYQRKSGISEAQALELARLGIGILVDRAAGSSPSADVGETRRILEIAAGVKGPLPELQSSIMEMETEGIRMALQVALLTDQPSTTIRFLVDQSPNLNVGDESPLFFALLDRKNVRYLLGHGAQVDYQNGFGKTALFYAIGRNDRSLVNLLLSNGADVNHRYLSNLKKDQFDCAYSAIEHTARSTLMHAAQHADVAMLKLLLKKGARLDDVDGVGYNAMDYALQADRAGNVGYLKSLGLPSLKVEEARKSAACSEEARSHSDMAQNYLAHFTACMSRPKPTLR